MHYKNNEEVIEALLAGELAALPTETVYGLAANALNETAVQKIFEVKGRPLIDPLIVHVYDVSQIESLAYVSELVYKLSDAFWPGPLTLLLPKKEIVPNVVTAGLPSVGIRVPKHPIFREILREAKIPLAAPSANPFGYLSPTEANHVKKTLGSKVKHIIDGGPCEIGIESTILNILDPQNPEILRPGPITAEDLKYVFGWAPKYGTKSSHKGAQIAPGLLKSHYSPRTRLKIFKKDTSPSLEDEIEISNALVFLKRPKTIVNTDRLKTFWLSEEGDLREVCKNLFSLLEKLDNQGFSEIFIELPEKEGLGIAICNRLERAAS